MGFPVKAIKYPFAVDASLGTMAAENDFAEHVKQMILQALNTWLGSLITVQEVKVEANNERLEIGISYSLKAQNGSQYLNVEVTI